MHVPKNTLNPSHTIQRQPIIQPFIVHIDIFVLPLQLIKLQVLLQTKRVGAHPTHSLNKRRVLVLHVLCQQFLDEGGQQTLDVVPACD